MYIYVKTAIHIRLKVINKNDYVTPIVFTL